MKMTSQTYVDITAQCDDIINDLSGDHHVNKVSIIGTGPNPINHNHNGQLFGDHVQTATNGKSLASVLG